MLITIEVNHINTIKNHWQKQPHLRREGSLIFKPEKEIFVPKVVVSVLKVMRNLLQLKMLISESLYTNNLSKHPLENEAWELMD